MPAQKLLLLRNGEVPEAPALRELVPVEQAREELRPRHRLVDKRLLRCRLRRKDRSQVQAELRR
jgi:hypothetical protein